MHYGIKTLFLFFTIILLAGCAKVPLSTFNLSKKGKPQTIAFYNTEKLYDTINDPNTDDDPFLPEGELNWTQEKYARKIANIAGVIREIGGGNGPEVIGLAEVENVQVVQDLVNSNELRKSKYSIIHVNLPGEQGLDIALLYKPRAFKPTSQQIIKIDNGRSQPSSGGILQVNGELQGEPVTLFINHWPARMRRNTQEDSNLRAAALALRKEITALQVANKDARIIVMGDFDAEPAAPVIKDVLKATGRPNPYYNKELFNTFYMAFVNGQGSFYSRGDFMMLDQIMISKSLIDGRGLEYIRGSEHIYNPEKIKFLYGKYKNTPRGTFSGTTYFGGYSDHFPIYIQVRESK
ncbi:endonuclease/exonuclease/phosphatase family protein [Pontibacter liquoris]|uniref:endonuclease/exonuclease/phosphatase family protein n=1 Tax=Pontibacter liquoris TaxID=2905677 RepID=UPI001FA79ADF|nr:endonuclease/exonuclease/phosphatase family protein [Pontibacter liquoris]